MTERASLEHSGQDWYVEMREHEILHSIPNTALPTDKILFTNKIFIDLLIY